jgi:probable F420-dependent oxidoreductase
MKFGVVFPTNEIGSESTAIRDWGEAADELGFSRVVVYDHVVSAVHADRDPPLWGPYDETYEFHEPLVLLGYLAAVTRSVDLATGILILPQRQTVLVAKQVAEVDVLSGGRVVLGVGVGYNPVEYQALDVPWPGRGARLDEQIEVLRALWTEHPIDLTTPQHRIDRAGLHPRPDRHIPIWIGGFSDRARQRAARVGDGFIIAPTTTANVRRQVRDLRNHLDAQRRDPSTFPIELLVVWAEGVSSVAESVELARELQLSHVTVNTMSKMYKTAEWGGKRNRVVSASPAEHISSLDQFLREFGR